MFRSLLVPLDGSPFSEHAIPFALGIASRAGAAVQFVHVHIPSTHATGISVLDSGADERVKETEWTYLDRAISRWQTIAPDVQILDELLEGDATEVLREKINDKTDLVVMATHGRGPLSRFWMGSVADTLLRTLSVPLLLLRPSEQPPAVALAPPFRKMTIPLDGSELAEEALKPCVQLGQLMEANLTLLRIVKPTVMYDPGVEWPAMTDTDEILTRHSVAEATRYLDRVAERLRGQGATVQTRAVLDMANPADAILDQSHDVDVIGLATHGRGGLRRMLLGSVADKILRGSHTPMLAYRPRIDSHTVQTADDSAKITKSLSP